MSLLSKVEQHLQDPYNRLRYLHEFLGESEEWDRECLGRIYYYLSIVTDCEAHYWSYETLYEDWFMTASTFSGQIINAPFTAFQIELMCNALTVYKEAGYDSKDVKYLEQQLSIFRNMLLMKYRRDLEGLVGWKSWMEDDKQSPEGWRCRFDMGYRDLRLIRDCVDFFYQKWPGYPARPLEEQEQLKHIRSLLDQAKLDYIYKFKWPHLSYF